MKPIIRYFLIFMILSRVVLHGAEFEDSEVPEEIRFIHGDTHYMTEEYLQEWERRLAETPDITNKIYEILWRYVEVKYETQIWQALFALSKRHDLSGEQVACITNRMKSLKPESAEVYTDSESNLQGDEASFLGGGVMVLKNYPSPDNEDLVLKVLGNEKLYMESTAAITLGKIGTMKSVEPMRNYTDRIRGHNTPPSKFTDRIFDAERELLARVRASSRKSKREDTGAPKGFGDKRPKSTTQTDQGAGGERYDWQVWSIAVIIIALGTIGWFRWALVKEK